MEAVDATLVGREPEMDVIRRFVAGAARDGGSMLLTGRTGAGKSAMLRWAVATARTTGVLVLPAEAVEQESDVPFAALHQLLHPVRWCLDELSTPDREVLSVALGFSEGPESDVRAVAAATEAALRQMSSRTPVMVAVDDWHLVDRWSAAALASVARRLPGVCVGFLATCCEDVDPADGPAALVGLPTVELGPLDPVAAAALLRLRFPVLAPEVAARIAAQACGYPLALVDWPGVLTDRERAGQARLPDPLPLGPRLRSAFAPRVRALPGAVRRTLLMAALSDVDDRPAVDRRVAAALASAQGGEGLHLDRPARRIDLSHPLIGPTVLAMSTGRERRDAHRALASLAGTAERRARHLAASTVSPDARVARVLERGAERMVERGDAAAGAASLLRSADLSAGRSDRSRRLALAARAEARSGRLQAAAALLDEARPVGPASAGSLEAAVAAADVALHTDGDLERAQHLLTEAVVRRGTTSRDPDRPLVDALQMLSDIRALAAGLAGPVAPIEDDLSGREAPLLVRLLLGAVPDPEPIVIAGATGVMPMRFAEGARPGPTSRADLETMALVASDALRGGRWAEAEQWSTAGLAACRASGHRLLSQHFRLCQAEVAAARGGVRTARGIAAEVDAWAAPRGLGALRTRCLQVRTLAASGEGDFELAYRTASAICPAGTVVPRVPGALRVALDLVEAAGRTNRHEQAAAHVAALRDSGAAALSPALAMVVGASSALTAPDDGARVLFDDALSVPGLERWPFDLARVELVYGERLRRMRAPGEARPHLEAALSTFTRLGADPWVARATTELNATGRAAADTVGPVINPLTPQERQVAMLAATGLTNKRIAERLLVSPRTVGAHLRQVFAKLGIVSRAALRDALGGDPLQV